MNRRFAASVLALALGCAGCSKNEQPAASAPPLPPEAAANDSGAPVDSPVAGIPDEIAAAEKAPDAAPQPNPADPPAMRGSASTKPIPAPGPPKLPLSRPERPPMLGSDPVLDKSGVERIALTPGAKAPKPMENKAPTALAPETFVPRNVPDLATPPPSAETPANTPPAAPAPAVATQPPAEPVAPTVPQLIYSVADPNRRLNNLNELIIDSINLVPAGGSYQADDAAINLLKNAVVIAEEKLQVLPDLARPSFCSSATYLVFLIAMDRLHRTNRVQLPGPAMDALLIRGQPDGEGVWGRWNANGPGTARLFHELGLGKSFSNPMAARPGDFLKIWWNDEIGAKERGHSVIFLGVTRTEKGEFGIRYWSSNKPGGFGEAVAPMSTVKRMLFSRLDNPRAILNAHRLPVSDQYLADMLKRASTQEEMCQMCGIQ
jgi:hypothetical protein